MSKKLHDRRIEQWNVYCWTRDRLAEGCQGYCVVDRGFI